MREREIRDDRFGDGQGMAGAHARHAHRGHSYGHSAADMLGGQHTFFAHFTLIRMINAPYQRLICRVIRRIDDIRTEVDGLSLVDSGRSTRECQIRQFGSRRNEIDGDRRGAFHYLQMDILRQVTQMRIYRTKLRTGTEISDGHCSACTVALIRYAEQRSVRSFYLPDNIIRQVLGSIIDRHLSALA